MEARWQVEVNLSFSATADYDQAFELCHSLPLLVPLVYACHWKCRVRLTRAQHLLLLPRSGSFRIGLDGVDEDCAVPHSLDAEAILDCLKPYLGRDAEEAATLEAIRLLQSKARFLLRHPDGDAEASAATP